VARVGANGTSFEVWTSGEPTGRPVVVGLHGLIIDDLSGFYFTLGATLREVADVVLYDLRGHGRSDFTPGGYALADQVEDLFALLDALGHTGPLHLLANSYGGAIAVTAARARPERVASIIMVEGHYPVPGWGAEMELTMAQVADRLTPEGAMEQLGITSRRKAERLVQRADLVVNHSSIRKELLDEPALTDAQLAALGCPVLCLYGGASDLVERGRHLAATVPGGVLHEFAGASHSLLTERTAELRDLVLAWIAEIAGGAAAAESGRA
jgi:pimeloyl-ACP methyl ester carboxylesterase